MKRELLLSKLSKRYLHVLEGPFSRQRRNIRMDIHPITGAKTGAEQLMHICYGRDGQSQIACKISLLSMDKIDPIEAM